MGGQRWTKEEDALLVEVYDKPENIAREAVPRLFPTRSKLAIQNRVKHLRKKYPRWHRWQRTLDGLPALEYTEVEKAWLACGIDCEGTISIDTHVNRLKNGEAGRTFSLSPYIFFGNSKKVIVDHFHRISKAPVSVFVMIFKAPDTARWKDQYHIKVRRAPWVYAFLRDISPYLIIKQEHAALAMEFLEIRHKMRSQYIGGYDERQLEIARRVRDLNERGKAIARSL